MHEPRAALSDAKGDGHVCPMFMEHIGMFSVSLKTLTITYCPIGVEASFCVGSQGKPPDGLREETCHLSPDGPLCILRWRDR